MNRIFLMAFALLLVGCVLTQDEIAQARGYMDDLAVQLQDCDTHMHQQDWAGARASIAAANETLSKLDALVATAESRGEDQQKIARLRAASGFTHSLFNYSSEVADYYITVEQMRDRLNTTDWLSENITQLRSELTALKARGDVIRPDADRFLATADEYKRNYPDDAGRLRHWDETISNVQQSKATIDEIQAKVQSVLDRMPAS